ncbi:MAG TPA: CbtA family protein [Methylocella sp.]|nr:CbtA family protein [Methylocella sp.]
MMKRVFSVGLIAGLIAGFATAFLLHFVTTPLILKAEAYETAAEATHGHDNVKAASEEQPLESGRQEKEWSPSDGLERTLSTAVATIVSAIGFALILIAAMVVAGEEITPMRALAWATGGFAATGLATGLGLAPELPGSAGAPLNDRQIWWIATAFASAFGLYLLIRTTSLVAKLNGLLFLLLPHLIGAPQPHHFVSTVPAELAAEFAASSLVIHAVLWAITGLCVGYFWGRAAIPAKAGATV